MRGKPILTGLIFLSAAAFVGPGCRRSGPQTGLTLGTAKCTLPASAPPDTACDIATDPLTPFPGIPVSGYTPPPTPPGTINEFGLVFTSNNIETQITSNSYELGWASAFVPNAALPATYDLFFILPNNCGPNYLYQTGWLPGTNIPFWEYNFPNFFADENHTPIFTCNYSGLSPASTRFAIVGSFPSTLTLGADSPLISQYGMPLLYVSDANGLVATETATSVSSDGTQATFPFPSSLQQAGYSIAIVNQVGEPYGSFAAATNLLSIAGTQSIAGNPFGVAVSGQTNSWEDRNSCNRTDTTGSTYSTFPVVSLYSSNQVLVNGSPVAVGANPTAVAVFTAAPVRTSSSNGCDSYQNTISGTTQAVVANSGGNTVSVLDIVNNAVLDTVTVGSQPVALVVSPDGSTAYVANYTDSTVTEVSLNMDTPVKTAAVGGHPTSVALAAPSTLWVGGVGFLSQVNAQTMSVVATESTSGKTIAALGFSDAENELIATTADASGNVFIDEVSPSTVYPGGAYTTAASHQVSTLGTYTNPQTQTQAQVQAFTSTLGQTSVPINTDLPGAPPLVVQDGWAVVTATPTGFTITDASGHVVLVSETTPSPIAAIAVDTNLNVAYLTEPDSKTLLSVPLPGTGNTGTNGSPGGFTVTATNNNPAQTALSLGHSMSYTINVSPVNGFAGTVSLWIDGLPAGVTASLSPASITTPGNATLTLSAA